MPILNYYAEGFISYPQMRAMCVHWSNGIIRDHHNLGSPTYNYARTAGEYDARLDWVRAMDVVLVVAALLIIIIRPFGIMMVRQIGRICVIIEK